MNKPPLVNRMLTVCRTMMHGEPILFVQGTLAEHRGNAAIETYTFTWNKKVPDPQQWFILSITKEGKGKFEQSFYQYEISRNCRHKVELTFYVDAHSGDIENNYFYNTEDDALADVMAFTKYIAINLQPVQR